jgi:phage terminase large subunit
VRRLPAQFGRAGFPQLESRAFRPSAAGTPIYFGADWGFTIDPSVLVACFIVGRTLYIWREVWELGVGIDRRGALFDKIDPDWNIARAKDPNWKSIARRYPITADSAEPQTIDFLQRTGFTRMQPAVKGPNSVEEGVSFLQGYDIVVHPDCKHAEKELRLYAYKTDKKTGAVLPELDDKDNHVIDALRYALETVRRATTTTRQELRF